MEADFNNQSTTETFFSLQLVFFWTFFNDESVWEILRDVLEKKIVQKVNRLQNPFRMDFLFEDSRDINVRFTDEVLRIKSAVQVGYYSG